jgi:hypothetical protein
MPQSIFLKFSVAVAILIFAGIEPVLSNETCMRIVHSGPPTENGEMTDNGANEHNIPYSKREQMAADLEKCLNNAYKKSRLIGDPSTSTASRQWYTRSADGFDYCETSSPILRVNEIKIYCLHADKLPDGVYRSPRIEVPLLKLDP